MVAAEALQETFSRRHDEKPTAQGFRCVASTAMRSASSCWEQSPGINSRATHVLPVSGHLAMRPVHPPRWHPSHCCSKAFILQGKASALRFNVAGGNGSARIQTTGNCLTTAGQYTLQGLACYQSDAYRHDLQRFKWASGFETR